ncbi:MAG: response regulator [Anaerolineae bacterium]|nr:response regulator [Anaerolineae bacterium]
MQKEYTILVVDDEQEALQLVEIMLQNSAFKITTARTGEEALAIAQSAPIDVVLLDVMMPDMSGVTVCGHLRATPHLRNIPIVILTALDDYATRRKAVQAGATDLLTKPVAREELLAKLNGVIAEYEAASGRN